MVYKLDTHGAKESVLISEKSPGFGSTVVLFIKASSLQTPNNLKGLLMAQLTVMTRSMK